MRDNDETGDDIWTEVRTVTSREGGLLERVKNNENAALETWSIIDG